VWRGLVIDDEMPRSAGDYISEIRKTGCPLGADGGKRRLMRGFRLMLPQIRLHEIDPFEAARWVQEAGPDSKRYDEHSEEWQAVCVCGDAAGAYHYATRSRGMGVVVRARVPADRLSVDGRDFLYTVIPELCKADPQSVEPVLPKLKAAFSEAVETYIEAGRALTVDVQLLFRLVDYLVTDRRVIEGHLASRVNLFGRYGTAFRSAFGVHGGIAASEIVDVVLADEINLSEEPVSAEELRLPDVLHGIRRR
jgi:hypothetical protein